MPFNFVIITNFLFKVITYLFLSFYSFYWSPKPMLLVNTWALHKPHISTPVALITIVFYCSTHLCLPSHIPLYIFIIAYPHWTSIPNSSWCPSIPIQIIFKLQFTTITVDSYTSMPLNTKLRIHKAYKYEGPNFACIP